MSTSSFKETVNTSLCYHKISFCTFEPGVGIKSGKIAQAQGVSVALLERKGFINESSWKWEIKGV